MLLLYIVKATMTHVICSRGNYAKMALASNRVLVYVFLLSFFFVSVEEKRP